MYRVNNTINYVTISKGARIFDTNMKAISGFYHLNSIPELPEYSTFIGGNGTIVLRFKEAFKADVSYELTRVTDVREVIVYSQSDGITLLKHYLQKLQDEAAKKNIQDLASSIVSITVSTFIEVIEAAKRLFRYGHHASVHDNSLTKQPKYDVVAGKPLTSAEVTALAGKIAAEGVPTLDMYSTFHDHNYQYVSDRNTGLSFANNKSWQKARSRFTPIRKIEIDDQGVLYLELYKFAYNPLKEERNIIKQFTNDVKNGIISIGWYTANIRDIKENYGLVSFKADIPAYPDYTANLALTLNGQPIALEVEIARSRS